MPLTKAQKNRMDEGVLRLKLRVDSDSQTDAQIRLQIKVLKEILQERVQGRAAAKIMRKKWQNGSLVGERVRVRGKLGVSVVATLHPNPGVVQVDPPLEDLKYWNISALEFAP